MRIIGKISISFATVISGSYIYAVFSQKDWNSVIQKHLPYQVEFPSIVPCGLRFLGFLVAQFPRQIFDLSQSDHFYVRNLVQQILASSHYPLDFDFKKVLEGSSTSTLIGLARIPQSDDHFFDTGNEVVPKGEEEKLNEAFRDLLSCLPTSGQDKCTRWFTQSAFDGGKSGRHLYKTIFWGPSEDHLDTVTPDEIVPLFLKALRMHSEVPRHRSLIVENHGLDLLQVVAQCHTDVKTSRLLSRILGNLALDEESHTVIISKGWIKQLREWMNSEDITIRSNSYRALANLDREGERGFTYEDGIFVIHPIKQLKCCKPEVDLVFVHGLRGSPFKTWRSGDSNNEETRTDCWPRDWFPSDVPSCRVILVEYDSEFSDWTSKCPLQPEISSIEYRSSELLRKLVNAGVGQRPVIWISHSMGGLLVKQLLVDASKSHKFHLLTTNTSAVIFYAVPHKGSDVASFVSGKARFLLRPSSEVKELQKGSDLLQSLHKNFLSCIQESHIDVLSFGETEPSRIIRDTLIVPPESADLGVGEFVQLPVNHIDICKPTSRLDLCYLRTVLFIKEHVMKSNFDDDPSFLLF